MLYYRLKIFTNNLKVEELTYDFIDLNRNFLEKIEFEQKIKYFLENKILTIIDYLHNINDLHYYFKIETNIENKTKIHYIDNIEYLELLNKFGNFDMKDIFWTIACIPLSNIKNVEKWVMDVLKKTFYHCIHGPALLHHENEPFKKSCPTFHYYLYDKLYYNFETWLNQPIVKNTNRLKKLKKLYEKL